MTSALDPSNIPGVQPFNRTSFRAGKRISTIGTGGLGGKARGLVFIHDILQSKIKSEDFPEITIQIPAMVVICTDIFDTFMADNDLYEIAYSDQSDDLIAHAFQKAALPFEILGDLRALISGEHNPLAIRSSSVMENSDDEPFAGIYITKMIPNNQHDIDTRFNKLADAIKLVYASTFSRAAKHYRKATGHNVEDEKMAVIIQEVVGKRHDERFYPELSGVARSYNFYPWGSVKHEDGIVNLALGMGKTIVDGEKSWSYSPARPLASPPFGSMKKLLRFTQNEFWAINLGNPPMYDPINETEYMLRVNISEAERDNTLRYIVSTLDPQSQRLTMGVGQNGPRVLNFSPLLKLHNPPITKLLKTLFGICETALNAPVEIEFAMTFDPHQFGFLQVRPMAVSSEVVDLPEEQLVGENVLTASKNTMGNGIINGLQDIIFVNPEIFEMKYTTKIALELTKINEKMIIAGKPYLLIALGRLGSTNSWLGIPVHWSQISGSKVIVEATQENANVEMSQGSHFFHNITSLGVQYFSVPFTGEFNIDWDWLYQQEIIEETKYIRHISLPSPLNIKVDGRNRRGVILKSSGAAHD